MRLALSLLLITAEANLASAQNPPTNYTPQTVPYNGSEAWYCEDVTHTANKQCRVVDFLSSISALANLTTANALTATGTITSGGAAGAGFSLNAGTITWVGTIPNSAFSAAYTIPFPITSGGTGTAAPALIAGNGIQITGSWPNNTITGKTGASGVGTPSNPASTVSTAGVMMGLGATLTVTPTKTGTVLFIINGGTANILGGGAGCLLQLKYGTGVAPSNGAAGAGAGSALGQAIGITSAANTVYPFSLAGVASGLSLSTTVWFDVQLATLAGGTCAVYGLSASVMEQ
jgi:hypothetical protein